jgi:drug/metabolite transporter superfamily protein YnfA
MTGTFHVLEWLRIGADAIFIVAGVVPLVLATALRVPCRRPVGDQAATPEGTKTQAAT